jgi:hypothetical protein
MGMNTNHPPPKIYRLKVWRIRPVTRAHIKLNIMVSSNESPTTQSQRNFNFPWRRTDFAWHSILSAPAIPAQASDAPKVTAKYR